MMGMCENRGFRSSELSQVIPLMWGLLHRNLFRDANLSASPMLSPTTHTRRSIPYLSLVVLLGRPLGSLNISLIGIIGTRLY